MRSIYETRVYRSPLQIRTRSKRRSDNNGDGTVLNFSDCGATSSTKRQKRGGDTRHAQVLAEEPIDESKMMPNDSRGTGTDFAMDELNEDKNGEEEAISQEPRGERECLREIEEEGNDFPPMEEVEQTFKNSQREMREIKSQISSVKASANTALERIDRALTEKNGAASQLERLRDDKKLRLQSFCRIVPTVGQAYKFIDENRKMFRKKIWGPVGELVSAMFALP